MAPNRRMVTALSVAVLTCGPVGGGRTAAADDAVKLSGCVVRAEDGDGYLLINVPRIPAGAPGAPAEPVAAATTTIGTTGVFTNIFYWLDKDDDLMPHIGHQVQVEGDLKGDLKDGQIKIDRKAQWTEIEVESDGRDMKARVPNASIVAGPDADRTLPVLVRRVDVSTVKMLDAACR
jgi:hypothetical protein